MIDSIINDITEDYKDLTHSNSPSGFILAVLGCLQINEENVEASNISIPTPIALRRLWCAICCIYAVLSNELIILGDNASIYNYDYDGHLHNVLQYCHIYMSHRLDNYKEIIKNIINNNNNVLTVASEHHFRGGMESNWRYYNPNDFLNFQTYLQIQKIINLSLIEDYQLIARQILLYYMLFRFETTNDDSRIQNSIYEEYKLYEELLFKFQLLYPETN